MPYLRARDMQKAQILALCIAAAVTSSFASTPPPAANSQNKSQNKSELPAVESLTLSHDSKSKHGDDWEKLGYEDGITVYRKEVPGSPILAFKGTGVINAPIAKVANILLDTQRAPEWADSLAESKVIKWISKPLEYVEYNHVDTPFLMKDRDFVSLVKVEPDPALGTLAIHYEADDTAVKPVEGTIRGDLSRTSFLLTSVESGARTWLEAQVYCDPKGSVPKWIVNFFQKSWPHNTIQSIRLQAAKVDVAEHPYFKNLFSNQAGIAATTGNRAGPAGVTR